MSAPVSPDREIPAYATEARAMWAYSLISSQPLGQSAERGQPVTLAQVRWLRERRLNGILAELTGLKSDDLKNRGRLHAAWKSGKLDGDEIPNSGTPETLVTLRTWLMAMGLDVALRSHADHTEVAIRAAATSDIIGWSNGPISTPTTVHYRTHEEIHGGIFCPDVFGRTGRVRRRRFGHVLLPVPIVPYWCRVGSPSVLERLLGLTAAQLKRVIGYTANVHWKRGRAEIVASDPGEPFEATGDFLGSGAAAIQQLLYRLPTDRLPPGLARSFEALTPSAVPIIPPDYRPLILLDNGDWATHDINDLYRELINRRNRVVKLRELNAPLPIIRNELRSLQVLVDQVHSNTMLPSTKAKSSDGRKLRDCFAMVADTLLTPIKRSDFCARAQVAMTDEISRDSVLIPGAIYRKLHLDGTDSVLVTSPHAEDGIFVALSPQAHDEPCIRLSADAFTTLRLHHDVVPTCVVHRPITGEARAEAKSLLHGLWAPSVDVPEQTGWLDGGDQDEILAGLIAAALSAEPVHWNTVRGLLLGGTGSTEIAADELLTCGVSELNE